MEKVIINDKGDFIWQGIYKGILYEIDNCNIFFKYPEGEETYFAGFNEFLTEKGVHKKRVLKHLQLGFAWCELQRKDKKIKGNNDLNVINELDKELNKWKDIIKSNTFLVFDGKFFNLNKKRLIVKDVDLTSNSYVLYQKTLRKEIIVSIYTIDEFIKKNYIHIIK